MLKELILHSLHCSQYIKYDCYKAPLDLHSATWFTSAAQDEIINFIGNAKRGSCPCSGIPRFYHGCIKWGQRKRSPQVIMFLLIPHSVNIFLDQVN